MIFSWFRNRRRQSLVARPFPSAWLEFLRANVKTYELLSSDEQRRVHDYVQVFVAEKNWEGCGGLAMTDEVRVTIAAQVAILVLGLPTSQYFDHVLSILVYPTAYVAPQQSMLAGGVITEGNSARLGEAWYRGPVIFSWAEVLAGARQTTHGNVVYHEFAHQIDMLNGRNVDGTPPLETAEQDRRWLEVNDAEFRQLVHECRHGHHTLIDCYGTTNRAEFFAVTTETFFTRPHAMRHRHPQLYALFCEVYRQDPSSRLPPD
jgi:Mlc titration factor MtfA (ptsG expression regulator)